MSDRYRPQVVDHLVRPRKAGEVSDPSGRGESGDASCGDIACFTVGISENILEHVRYKVYGCAACIAAGSALAELVEGGEAPEGILEAQIAPFLALRLDLLGEIGVGERPHLF